MTGANFITVGMDPEDPPPCPQCGEDPEYVECEPCGGNGFDGHDCGEDCCMCADPEDNLACGICQGDGSWMLCPNRSRADHASPPITLPREEPDR